MTTLVYQDAYLARFCDDDREDRAFDEVDQYGTFAAEWRNKLTVLRCYILACLENQADPDDLFSAKLINYRKEFEFVLAQARADTPDSEGIIPPILSVPLERA